MKRLYLLLFFIIISTYFKCSAQGDFRNGFIITNERDTIYGQIKYRGDNQNLNSCIFKKDNDIIEYSSEQINGFGYENDNAYSSGILKGSFVEVLVVGSLNLFKYESSFYIKKNRENNDKLENNESEAIVELKEDNRWRGTLNYLIYDCFPNGVEKLNKIKFSEENLTELVIQYNKCMQSDYIDIIKRKPWTKIDWGVSIGLVRSSLLNKSDDYSDISKSYYSIDPTIGLILELSYPRFSDRLTFQPEINLTKSSYSNLIKIDGSYPEFKDTYIDLTTISVPLSLKYSFPKKGYSLYLQGGVDISYHIITKARAQSEIIISDYMVYTYPETELCEFYREQVGLWGGFGIQKPFNRVNLSANIRYYQMTNLHNSLRLPIESNRMTLSIIFLKK
ncbi:MAG: PorT family protein [Bacteroidales bacterium]|nr:PorT family protein [Bacteroidales bacterium]